MRRLFGRERSGSLFLQVLERVTVPLVLLCLAAVLITYFAAAHRADLSFDRELSGRVSWVADQLADARSREHVAEVLRERMRLDSMDNIVVQVVDGNGALVAGEEGLPAPGISDSVAAGTIHFREASAGNEPLRIAYRVLPAAGDREFLVVQAGETLQRRRDLAGGVTWTVVGILALLISAAVALVWMGLQRGLAPLETLRARIEARDAADLSPIVAGEVPAEIEPLVNTLNRQLERVRRNLEAQRRFVLDAAHQMRTPIAGLKTQAQVALRGDTLGEARERLVQIEESAERLVRLMTQLLALARAEEAGTQAPLRESVDLNALLRDVCSQCADRALAKPLQLDLDAEEPHAQVAGSPVLLRELFANLVDNAIRYTPSGGEVAVRVASVPAPQVIVEDTGVGIAPQDRELVFERFYRVLGTGESGSGLGLPIVKAIAELHGAAIHVEDREEGAGTRFRVVFARAA